MTSKSGNRYSPKLRERAVRMLLEQRDNYTSDNAAVKSIAPKQDVVPILFTPGTVSMNGASMVALVVFPPVNVSILKSLNVKFVNCGAVTISCVRLRYLAAQQFLESLPLPSADNSAHDKCFHSTDYEQGSPNHSHPC